MRRAARDGGAVAAVALLGGRHSLSVARRRVTTTPSPALAPAFGRRPRTVGGASTAPAPCRASRGLRPPLSCTVCSLRPLAGGCVCRLSCRLAAAPQRARGRACGGCTGPAPSGLPPPAPMWAGAAARKPLHRKISGGGGASAADRLGRQRPFLLALPPSLPKCITSCHGIPGVKRPLSSSHAGRDGPFPRHSPLSACSTATWQGRRAGPRHRGSQRRC